jgi:membrane protein
MRRYAREIAHAFVEHNLLTYAAAIAFQALIALVPLTLLALGVLGATGHEHVWKSHLAPSVEHRVTAPVFRGIDDTARRVLEHGTAGVITVGALLSLWYLTAAMRAVIEALDQIHDVKDKRGWGERVGTAVILGAVAGAGLYGAALLIVGAGIGGRLSAVVLAAVVVTLLLRFAPAQRPNTSWASLGTLLILGSWAVASALFWVWITYVANFRSAVGTMTSLLVLTSYVFVSAAVFLVGAQLDELLRKQR